MDQGIVDFREAKVSDEICKTLVEPEIVPPLHSDEVAEPVVRQLVDHNAGKVEVVIFSRIVEKESLLPKGNQCSIFHSAGLEVPDEYLIIFDKGVFLSKETLEEGHRFLHNIEYETAVAIQQLQTWLYTVYSHGHRS